MLLYYHFYAQCTCLTMIQESLTPEQEAKLAEALEVAKLAEQKGREMSELAEAIAQKYYNRLLDAALAAEKRREN